MEQALGMLSPDFVAHMVGLSEPLDAEGFREFGMSFYVAFSEGKHVFDEVVVEGDRVVTCGTFSATHLGEFQGLPPTGKKVSLAVMHIDRVRDGQIVEHWGQGDALGMMQQLGVVFFPGPKLIPHIVRGVLSKLTSMSS